MILGGIGGAGWYVTHTAPASAGVGDCLAQTGGNDLTKVSCGDPSARFSVLGKLENKTMVDASLNACSAFPKATSSYWEGKDGELGLVLCLAPVEPVAAAQEVTRQNPVPCNGSRSVANAASTRRSTPGVPVARPARA